MKDPAFLFYTQDFLTGTMFMNDEQVGIYIRLLCAQHQLGGMIERSAFLSRVNNNTIIANKFIETDEGYFNERLMVEMEKRSKKSCNLSANAKVRWDKEKQKKCKSNAIASNLNMPIENENEDILLKKRYDEFTENLRSQRVYERLAMNVGIKPTEIMYCIEEFIDSCYGEFTLKTTKLQVEQYFMSWIKKEGKVKEAVNNQMRKLNAKK